MTETVTEIADRFKIGDPAEGALLRLQASLPILIQQVGTAGNLPDDLRTEIAALLDRIGATVVTGDEWLARTGQELVAQQVRQRLQRTYGAT